MSRLPALFVTHGAPTLPLEPGPTGPFLRDLAGEVMNALPGEIAEVLGST